jgi:hypothetical protein
MWLSGESPSWLNFIICIAAWAVYMGRPRASRLLALDSTHTVCYIVMGMAGIGTAVRLYIQAAFFVLFTVHMLLALDRAVVYEPRMLLNYTANMGVFLLVLYALVLPSEPVAELLPLLQDCADALVTGPFWLLFLATDLAPFLLIAVFDGFSYLFVLLATMPWSPAQTAAKYNLTAESDTLVLAAHTVLTLCYAVAFVFVIPRLFRIPGALQNLALKRD